MTDIGIQFFGESVEASLQIDSLYKFLENIDLFISGTENNIKTKSSHPNQNTENLTEIIFSSFIVAVVSFMERQAQYYAKTLDKAAKTPLKMADLSGTWHERFRKFVERLAHLDISMTEADWNDLRGLVEIRNCLAHSGGLLRDFGKRQVIEQFISKYNISQGWDDYLQADRELAYKTLSIVNEFIEKIYRAAIFTYPR